MQSTHTISGEIQFISHPFILNRNSRLHHVAMNRLLRLNTVSMLRGITRAPVRLIATEQKKNASSASTTQANTPTPTDFSEEAHLKSKNWVSYGWDHKDKEADRNYMKTSFFLVITLSMVGFGFVLAYEPDRRMSNWAQREAFIVLRERELAGKDPIAANYHDPATVVLPSEEELGDVEIII